MPALSYLEVAFDLYLAEMGLAHTNQQLTVPAMDKISLPGGELPQDTVESADLEDARIRRGNPGEQPLASSLNYSWVSPAIYHY